MIGFLARTFNPELVKTHTTAIMMIWALFACVPASFALLMVFLFMGSFTLVDLGLDSRDALVFDVGLSLAFFLQHSVMIRKGPRKKLGAFISGHYHDALYGLTSGIILGGVMIFWQGSPTVLAGADGVAYWALRGLLIVCVAGFIWAVKSLGSFDSLGVKPLMRHITDRQANPPQLAVRGPYRWTRHPLYLFMIVAIWSCPVLTLDRLVFDILWTSWIVIGTLLEDRDLHREFGDQYRAYSSRVPMLIPYRIPGGQR